MFCYLFKMVQYFFLNGSVAFKTLSIVSHLQLFFWRMLDTFYTLRDINLCFLQHQMLSVNCLNIRMWCRIIKTPLCGLFYGTEFKKFLIWNFQTFVIAVICVVILCKNE